MICNKCGKEINDGAIFCQYCGEKNIEDVFQNKPLYNTVPIWKIIALSIISLGFYQIVWAFNLWKQAQKKYDKKISPFWRSIFCPITNFELFPLINEYISDVPKGGDEALEDSNLDKPISNIKVKPFHAIGYAVAYIILNFIDRMLSNASSHYENYSAGDLIAIIPSIIIFSIIAIIQFKINKFNNLYNIPAKNDKWTWKTTGFVVLWLLAYAVFVFAYAVILTLTSNS